MRLFSTFFALLTATLSAVADQWKLPEITTYFSENQIYKLVVYPRELGAGGNSQALAIFYKVISSDKIDKLWEAKLENDVAPTQALVSNDGKYVITFDNWHMKGHGDNVIVIFDSDGKLKQKYSLIELLGEKHFAALPRTVSSIWWNGTHKISVDNKHLVLEIVTEESTLFDRRYMTKRINLSTGEIVN